MTRTTTLLAALATLALAASAEAQVNIGWGGGGGNGGFVTVGGGGRSFGPPRSGWGRPNRRFVTQPEVTHFDPWSGTVHTQNQEVFESVNDFGRNRSRNNGTMRRVNRPIYDNFGNLTGHEQGVEWRNSLTGQRHHETTKTTVNNFGGWNNQQSVQSVQSSRSMMAPRMNTTRSVGNTAGFGGSSAP